MTRINETFYVPEPFFIFADAFILRKRSNDELEFLWTLQKDRVKENLWTPPGGEVVFPTKPKGEIIEPSETAIRETFEEVGLRIEPLWQAPFYTCFVFNDYPEYKVRIHNKNRIGSPGENSTRVGAFSLHNYYLCKSLMENDPVCAKQPDESDYEIVDLKWLTLEETNELLKKGTIKTFDTIKKAMKIIETILKDKKLINNIE